MFVELIPLAAILGSFTMTVIIVVALTRARQRKQELQAQVQTKLIERFGSTPELIDFLQSPAGKEFVSGVQSAPVLHTRERAVAGISRAVIMAALGLGFAGIWLVGGIRGFLIPAFLFMALGVGFLLAGLTSMKLSGLIAPRDDNSASRM